MSYDDARVDLPRRTCPKCGREYFMRRETCAACRGETYGTAQPKERCTDVSGNLIAGE